jgi:hypothetical protein
MTLRYSDRPVLNYGGPSRVDELRAKLPQGAMPIGSAPTASATPVVVYARDPKGEVVGHWALYHRNGWQKLKPYTDTKDRSVSWRMCGEEISQPIAWAMPRRK